MTGKVKETQCIMYRDHCEGAQNAHGSEYIHASARRAQVLEIDDSESIQENRNTVVYNNYDRAGKYKNMTIPKDTRVQIFDNCGRNMQNRHVSNNYEIFQRYLDTQP